MADPAAGRLHARPDPAARRLHVGPVPAARRLNARPDVAPRLHVTRRRATAKCPSSDEQGTTGLAGKRRRDSHAGQDAGGRLHTGPEAGGRLHAGPEALS